MVDTDGLSQLGVSLGKAFVSLQKATCCDCSCSKLFACQQLSAAMMQMPYALNNDHQLKFQSRGGIASCRLLVPSQSMLLRLLPFMFSDVTVFITFAAGMLQETHNIHHDSSCAHNQDAANSAPHQCLKACTMTGQLPGIVMGQANGTRFK